MRCSMGLCANRETGEIVAGRGERGLGDGTGQPAEVRPGVHAGDLRHDARIERAVHRLRPHPGVVRPFEADLWKEKEMPPRPGRVGRRGVIGNPVARTAAVVGTAAGARCQPAPRPARRPPRRQTGPPRRPPRPSILTPRATDPHPTDARIGVRRQGPRDRSACGGLNVAYLGGQRGLLRWRRGGCRRNVAEHADRGGK